MTAPLLAWGEQSLYRLPDDRHVYGRQFELLPAATMFTAQAILGGLIGVLAEPAHEGHAFIRDGAKMIIIGVNGTESQELEGYRDDIIESFRQRQAMPQGG